MKNTKLLLTLSSVMAFLGMQVFCIYLFLSEPEGVGQADFRDMSRFLGILTILTNILCAYAIASCKFEDKKEIYTIVGVSIIITYTFLLDPKAVDGATTIPMVLFGYGLFVWRLGNSAIPQRNKLVCLGILTAVFLSFFYLALSEGKGLTYVLASWTEESKLIPTYAKCTSLCILANSVILKLYLLSYWHLITD